MREFRDACDARRPARCELLVASDVAELLDDQTLDAEIQDENVAFTIRPQAVDGQPPLG